MNLLAKLLLLVYLGFFLAAELSPLGAAFTMALITLVLFMPVSDNFATTRVITHRLLVTYLAVLHVQFYIGDLHRVENRSMVPKLYPGDLVWIDKLSPGLLLPWKNLSGITQRIAYNNNYRKGDIIIFRQPGTNQLIIKKVNFLPGETIRLSENILSRHVPESPVPESIASKGKTAVKAFENGISESMITPAGMVGVLGENLPASVDSRHWGFVPFEYILGKVQFIFPYSAEQRESA